MATVRCGFGVMLLVLIMFWTRVHQHLVVFVWNFVIKSCVELEYIHLVNVDVGIDNMKLGRVGRNAQ